MFNKHSFIIFAFVAIASYSFSQIPQHIILETPLYGYQSHEFVAEESILLTDGYSFIPRSPYYLNAWIDDDIINPISYSSSPINIDDRELDFSLPVGSSAGVFSVNVNGAAEYSIPIFVPPGTNGMEPSLSIYYNSQGGNGIIGCGWSISGLSSIQRVPQSLFYDAAITNIDYLNDRFVIDGQRLIEISGLPYGQNQSKYCTEVFNGTRITGLNDNMYSFTIDYFKVETKDNGFIYYGLDEDSKVIDNNGNILQWHISKIEDVNGNYIEYIYQKDGNQCVLKEIKYTGNISLGLTPYNKVKFIYGNEREDNFHYYINGFHVEQNLLLKEIKIYNEADVIRRYKFNYYFDHFSRLFEIYEFGSDGERVNSTIFEYGEWGADFEDYDVNLNYSFRDYYSGDYTGDGQSDLLVIHFEYWPSYPTKRFTKWELFENQSDGHTFTLLDSDNFTYAVIGAGIHPGDFNGDGLMDFVVHHVIPNGLTFTTLLRLFIANDLVLNPGDKAFEAGNINGCGVLTNQSLAEVLIADFNGDNKDDILEKILPVGGTDEYIYKVLLANGPPENWNFTSEDIQAGSIQLFNQGRVGNFDGDAKLDFLLVIDDNCYIFRYSYTLNSFELLNENGVAFGYPTKWHRIFTGDFNGDNIWDVMSYTTQTHIWEIHYFDGKDFEWNNNPTWPSSYNVDPTASNTDFNYFIADYNGDGLSDILENVNSTNSTTLNVYYSDGQEFYPAEPHVIDRTGVYMHFYDFADFNGDGNVDFMIRPESSTPAKLAFFNKNSKSFMVDRSANGFNRIQEVEYLPLTNNSVYEKYHNSFGVFNYNYKIRDVQFPLHVVRSLAGDNGISGTRTILYKYKGARIHLGGKGLLGYQDMIIQDNLGNKKIENHFTNLSPYYIQTLDKSTTKTISNELLSEVSNINNIKIAEINPSSNPYYQTDIIIPYVEESESIDYLKGITVTSSYDIDTWGNLIEVITDFNSEGSTLSVMSYTNSNSGGNGTKDDDISWYPSKLDNKTTTMSRLNNPDYVRSTDFSYYDNGMLRYSINDPGKTKYFKTEFEYNDFGNISKSSHSNTDLGIRFTDYKYDVKNRFVIEATNELGHKAKYLQNPASGQITSHQDPNGNRTITSYDDFNRLQKVTPKDDKQMIYHYEWYSGTEINHAIFSVEADYIGGANTKEYLDLLGREVLSCNESFDGQMINLRSVYNNKGQLDKTSEPFFESNSPDYWTSYFYDPYGRIDYIEFPNMTNDYSYNENSITIINALGTSFERSSTSTYDAWGNINNMSDPSGLLQYSYYSSNLLKDITNIDGSITSITYDEYGQQKTLEDPDAGTMEYDYNAFGELIFEKDKRGNEFTFIYDQIGRIDLKTCNDGSIIDYIYDTEDNGIGLISTVQHSNGTLYSYEYDSKSRVKAVKQTIDDIDYNTTYSYDAHSNMECYNYPSGFALEYDYNDNGYLTQIKIKNSEQILVEPKVYNQRGQITEYVLGNNKMTTNQYYDDFGFITGIETTNGSLIQDLEYSIDPVSGNMDFRKDMVYGLTEDFAYNDNLKSRLNSWQVTGLENYTANYYDNGNIQNKSDVGHYSYAANNAGPHALTKISSPVQFPAETNQQIEYNAFNKVSRIFHNTENKELLFTYGPFNNRKITRLYDQEQLTKVKHFINNNYEIISEDNRTLQLNYIKGPEGLVGIYVQDENNNGNLYFILKDHLGSYKSITDENGIVLEELSFDPWGNRRNPQTWGFGNIPTAYIFDRGYTGHEHLEDFDLINMNGRAYDPILARFLSPDNYVQAPEYSQSLNRYTYCLNNPLKYTDPSGEFFIADSWLIGFVDGFFSSGSDRWGNGWKEGIRRADLDARITTGWFVTDPNKTFGGQVWEVLSRFTWQFPQSIGGWGTAQWTNTIEGNVNWVKYKYGATVTQSNGNWGGITQGSFIMGDETIEADANNYLFQHEYGHYLQSQSMGWAYYPRIGIPSIRSKGAHDFHPAEQDANRRAFLYFNKNVDDFYVAEQDANQGRGWNFWTNPLNVNGSDTRGQYVDYQNAAHVATLDRIGVRAKWYDHASWLLLPIGGPVWVGLINAGIYNR